jgi:hypothetical protein
VRVDLALLYPVTAILLVCGIASTHSNAIDLKTDASREPNLVPPVAMTNRSVDRSGLVAGAIQSGMDALEALRTLTCQQKVDVYENGTFRDSTEFWVDFNNGLEHYSNVIRAERPVFFEDEPLFKRPIEYFAPPFSVGEYAESLQEALARMKALKASDLTRMVESNKLFLLSIDVRHPGRDFWTYSSGEYYAIPYTLTVYIDPITARIHRIFKGYAAGDGIPATLWYVNYLFESVNEQRYWVPVSASYESALRDKGVFANKISFDSYKQFTVGSQISFSR